MLQFGHNANLTELNGVRVFEDNPASWGSLIPKAEYLSQFGQIKAWEIMIRPHQLRPAALEQLAQAMPLLAKHRLFADLDWLSFHFPTEPQAHRSGGEINQDKWLPFYQLLQVLDRFPSAKKKCLNFHILAESSLPQVWRLDRAKELANRLSAFQEEAKEIIAQAVKLRDHLNPNIILTIENNPPYNDKNHTFHGAGLFPQEIKQWQYLGVESCLDLQHASLVQWYRNRYGYDGPIPIMDALHHRSSMAEFAALQPAYLHLAGAPDTPESLHAGNPIGFPDDDIDWPAWLTALRQNGNRKNLPAIIELVGGHLPENWAACQTSAVYLSHLLKS